MLGPDIEENQLIKHMMQSTDKTTIPSLPDANPRSERFGCGGRESKFLGEENPIRNSNRYSTPNPMRLRQLFAPILAVMVAFTQTAHASQDAMMELFKILKDRGSISQAEYSALVLLSKKDEKKEERKIKAVVAKTTAPSESLQEFEKKLKKDESLLATIDKKLLHVDEIIDDTSAAVNNVLKGKWYERLDIGGYTQFRYHRLLDNEASELNHPADRSISETEGMLIRRGRFKLSGDLSDHLFLYSQIDFAGSVFGSGGSLGLQARDLYGDISVDTDKVYRFRFGLSKVPFGFVNLQSSQNRAPFERPDALNSAVEGERDLGAYFMYTPVEVRKRFKELVRSGLKGSGDYGMLTFGVFNGQGLNRSDKNNEPHVLARATYPFKFANGQFFETSIQGYYGNFVPSSGDIKIGGKTIKPKFDEGGVKDARVGVSAILYPQPFGFEAEWNVGQGPTLSGDYKSIKSSSLHGGYLLANYRLKTSQGELFPFARWSYYDGGRKFGTNAPRSKVNEIDVGFEWSPWKEVEIALMYTHTIERTNTAIAPYTKDAAGANRIGLQIQWNY